MEKNDFKRVKEKDELVAYICKGDGNRPVSPERSHTVISPAGSLLTDCHCALQL